MLIKTPLLYQSLDPCVFLSFFLFLSFSFSLYFWLIPWNSKVGCVTQGILASFLLSLSHCRLRTSNPLKDQQLVPSYSPKTSISPIEILVPLFWWILLPLTHALAKLVMWNVQEKILLKWLKIYREKADLSLYRKFEDVQKIFTCKGEW